MRQSEDKVKTATTNKANTLKHTHRGTQSHKQKEREGAKGAAFTCVTHDILNTGADDRAAGRL